METPKPPVKRKRGRPPGRKNNKTLVREAIEAKSLDILQKGITDVMKAVIEEAKGGNMMAAKLILDRAVPVLNTNVNPAEKGNQQIIINIEGMTQETPAVIEGDIISSQTDNED